LGSIEYVLLSLARGCRVEVFHIEYSSSVNTVNSCKLRIGKKRQMGRAIKVL
jgi:hypothetical protein